MDGDKKKEIKQGKAKHKKRDYSFENLETEDIRNSK